MAQMIQFFLINPVKLFISLLAVLFLLTALFSADVIAEERDDVEQGRQTHFSIIDNAPHDVQINDVCCGQLENEFNNSKMTRFNSGFGKSIFWLKFEPIDKPGILDLGPQVNDAVLYLLDPKTGKIRTSRSGDNHPASVRQLLASHIAFQINDEDLGAEIFVRIHHEKIRTFIPRFFDAENFAADEAQSMKIHLWVMGASCIMIMFNFLLGILVRQIVFLYYSVTVTCLLAGSLYISGFGPAYVWGQWGGISNIIFDFANVFGVISSGLFIFEFLGRDRNISRLVYLPLLAPILVLPAYFISWFIPIWVYQIILALLAALGAFFSMGVAGILAFQGNKEARLLLPTLLLVLLPNLIMFWAYRFWTIELLVPADHIIEAVLFLDALLFSLLLSYRIRLAVNGANTAYAALKLTQDNVNTTVLASIDNERRRIAADLHDSAGQGLLAITNRLSGLLNKKKSPSQQHDEVKKVAEYSRGVIGDIRRISHELHPAIIDHLGWHDAIEELFNTLGEVHEIETHLEIRLSKDELDKVQQLHLYRIVQEAVTNIAKHSSATKCSAVIENNENYCVICLTDNGKLVVDNISQSRKSIGKTIIAQRASVLGGTSSYHSNNSQTILTVRFPLQTTFASEGVAQ